MWRANGNPNPCTDLNEILQAHPHLSKEEFGAGLAADPYTRLGLGIMNPFKLKDTFLKTKDVEQVAN